MRRKYCFLFYLARGNLAKKLFGRLRLCAHALLVDGLDTWIWLVLSSEQASEVDVPESIPWISPRHYPKQLTLALCPDSSADLEAWIQVQLCQKLTYLKGTLLGFGTLKAWFCVAKVPVCSLNRTRRVA